MPGVAPFSPRFSCIEQFLRSSNDPLSAVPVGGVIAVSVKKRKIALDCCWVLRLKARIFPDCLVTAELDFLIGGERRNYEDIENHRRRSRGDAILAIQFHAATSVGTNPREGLAS